MPRASSETAARSANGPGYEGRFDELGDYTVAFEKFSEGGDMAPLFRGLPDDRCQCPHWGIVVKGRLTFTYADGQDVVEAGRGLLRARRTHPCRGAGHRDDRVQPQRGSPRHHGGRHEERPSAGREGLTR